MRAIDTTEIYKCTLRFERERALEKHEIVARYRVKIIHAHKHTNDAREHELHLMEMKI